VAGSQERGIALVKALAQLVESAEYEADGRDDSTSGGAVVGHVTRVTWHRSGLKLVNPPHDDCSKTNIDLQLVTYSIVYNSHH
jgi:hypothetical protein